MNSAIAPATVSRDNVSLSPLGDAHVAPTAALLADPSRATMLWALSDGRALPAGELARLARIGAPAASAHLARLIAGGLLSAERHGRHRYYRLADPRVVEALEALAAVAPPVRAASTKEQHAGSAVRLARSCYDHLAGSLGVRITEALCAQGAITLVGREYAITALGETFVASIGINYTAVVDAARRTRRPVTRACLDWSERRYHLAGALGAALLTRLLELEWVERTPSSRALKVTNEGRRSLRRHFDVQLF